MINLFQCRCGGSDQESRSWESCICPRTWALPGIGRVLISKSGVSMKLRRRLQNVPVVRMFWWHKPQKCPPFIKHTEFVDDGLYPILAPRVYQICRERLGMRKYQQNREFKMKVYKGEKSGYDRQVVVVESGKSVNLSPEPSQEIINHSPDGFNWGYGGSGPAQLALGFYLT